MKLSEDELDGLKDLECSRAVVSSALRHEPYSVAHCIQLLKALENDIRWLIEKLEERVKAGEV
jgi:hypothetical protein